MASKVARYLRQDGAAVGDARVGDQDVEIFPGRLGEFRLRIEEVHDPQVGRKAGQQLVEQRARHVASLRQRPDRLEAVAEIRRRGADRRRRHQRMAGRAVSRSIRAAPAWAAGAGGGAAASPGSGALRTACGYRRSAQPAGAAPRSAPDSAARIRDQSCDRVGSRPDCSATDHAHSGLIRPSSAMARNHCSSSHVIWLRSRMVARSFRHIDGYSRAALHPE